MPQTAGRRQLGDDQERTSCDDVADQSDNVDVIESTQDADLVEEVLLVFDRHSLTAVARQYSH